MKKSLTMNEALNAFQSHLKGNSRLCSAAGFWHGFESWLKFELASLFCHNPWHCEQWKQYKAAWYPEDIGLEYRWKTDDSKRGAKGKLVDFWVRSGPAPVETCHYFELKVVFNNDNAAKQIWSWLSDFNMLCKLPPEDKAVGCASVIFAVGWEVAGWSQKVDEVLGDCLPKTNVCTPVTLLSAADCPMSEGVLMQALAWPSIPSRDEEQNEAKE